MLPSTAGEHPVPPRNIHRLDVARAVVSAEPAQRHVAPGGVVRLASMRPWAVALYVYGFFDARHARKFETAWQLGFRSSYLRFTARFVPTRGAVGRAEVLHSLLVSRRWRDHQLCEHVVRLGPDATAGERARFERMEAALCGYRYVTYGPHM